MLETIVAVSLGIALSAACGFRVFVPMVVVGLAARAELVTLSDGFHWIGSDPAILVFGIATVLEITAYYLPWVDNLLDGIASPIAVVAGVVVAAACFYDLPPLLKWSLAVIAGGGGAGIVQTGTVALRIGTSMGTGGVANPVVSTAEWLASLIMSILAILLPILAAVLAIVLVAILVRIGWRTGCRFLSCRERAEGEMQEPDV
jgi:hypothetical protein